MPAQESLGNKQIIYEWVYIVSGRVVETQIREEKWKINFLFSVLVNNRVN